MHLELLRKPDCNYSSKICESLREGRHEFGMGKGIRIPSDSRRRARMGRGKGGRLYREAGVAVIEALAGEDVGGQDAAVVVVAVVLDRAADGPRLELLGAGALRDKTGHLLLALGRRHPSYRVAGGGRSPLASSSKPYLSPRRRRGERGDRWGSIGFGGIWRERGWAFGWSRLGWGLYVLLGYLSWRKKWRHCGRGVAAV